MLLERFLNATVHPAKSAPSPAALSSERARAVPNQLTFAQEIRADRLALLWKGTLFGAGVAWWALIVLSGLRSVALTPLVAPTVALAAGCLGAGQFLRRAQFVSAVWSYALGASLAIALAMASGQTFGRSYAAYVLPLVVFTVGMLLPARDTLILLLIAALAALGLPALAESAPAVTTHTAFALLLATVAAGLAAQISSELSAIAEWAIENYRRERRTTIALMQSREALQCSFLRQQALAVEVQRANQALEQARRAEEEAKRLRGQFLATMSHELRTPLNAIIGFSQTMLELPAMYDDVPLPAPYRKDVSQILTSGRHMLTLVNDMLDLSKVDAGKLEIELQAVDLRPVLEDVLSTAVGLVADKADKVQLVGALPNPLPVVWADPLRLRQILLNLYSNAAKFTDAGHIHLRVRTEKREVIFCVADTGIGIAEEDQATIFDAFRQGAGGRRKGREGSGLGLAIAEKLARLMHGRLWFKSEPGKGSTFYLALPLYVPAPSLDEPGMDQADTRPLEAVFAEAGP